MPFLRVVHRPLSYRVHPHGKAARSFLVHARGCRRGICGAGEEKYANADPALDGAKRRRHSLGQSGNGTGEIGYRLNDGGRYTCHQMNTEMPKPETRIKSECRMRTSGRLQAFIRHSDLIRVSDFG